VIGESLAIGIKMITKMHSTAGNKFRPAAAEAR
jgi:hypothetical protein